MLKPFLGIEKFPQRLSKNIPEGKNNIKTVSQRFREMSSENQKLEAAHYKKYIEARSRECGEVSKTQIIKDIIDDAIKF